MPAQRRPAPTTRAAAYGTLRRVAVRPHRRDCRLHHGRILPQPTTAGSQRLDARVHICIHSARRSVAPITLRISHHERNDHARPVADILPVRDRGLSRRRGSRRIGRGLPAVVLVGMPDAAIRESTHRVARAMVNSGFNRPNDRIVVNLAPAGFLLDSSGMLSPPLG